MTETIYLIEDDPMQSESIVAALQKRFGKMKIELFETESEFRKSIPSFQNPEFRSALVISDVMLPWAHPSPNSPPLPEDVEKGTFRKAGVRCYQEFRKVESLRDTPWIFFTVLDDKSINFSEFKDKKAHYIQKSASIAPLLKEIHDALELDREWTDSDETVTDSFLRSKMRSILIEGLSTPLNACIAALP